MQSINNLAMKQTDLFQNFFHFSVWRNDVSFLIRTIISKLGYFDVRAIWILSVGSNRFLCFVFIFIKVENPCSLSLLSPYYPQEFHFDPTLGNFPRFADPWSRVNCDYSVFPFKLLPRWKTC
jgi:hypothetical protein